jgi:S-DNA-T family DNA segregation ATPase FtsK/SpoIIIE
MNSIIISLLYKSGPEDVKIIMIDPKMVELGIYNGIPHLLIPVVTDPKKAAGSLQWAVNEMMRRYKIMSDAGVRDLESYNSIVEAEEEGQKLPQVVVIIDELADLMLVAAKEVEESICRIAQMGRAAGIHLVIATQRPSADVITGLMKANIPSRIAFSVASAMESRIILDTQGAEKLVGRGDMLFSPIGMGKPVRVQGCYVSDEEVEAVASYVKDNYMSSYDAEIMDDIDRRATQTGTNGKASAEPEPNSEELDGDEMLTAAVDVFMETGQASVSMLQRRLKLGYARAARIVDEMQEKGIVGPFQGSKPRTILVTKEQWEAMKAGQPAQMNMDELAEENPSDEDPFV